MRIVFRIRVLPVIKAMLQEHFAPNSWVSFLGAPSPSIRKEASRDGSEFDLIWDIDLIVTVRAKCIKTTIDCV
jgi:hypothetical protein